jgi:hypothetical protein
MFLLFTVHEVGVSPDFKKQQNDALLGTQRASQQSQ